MHDINSSAPLPAPQLHLCARHCLLYLISVHGSIHQVLLFYAHLCAAHMYLVQAKCLWSAGARECIHFSRAPCAKELILSCKTRPKPYPIL